MNIYMYKKANTQLISAVILFLAAIVFSIMLFNIGDRFINNDGVYIKYHLMETAYVMETMLAAPSFVRIDYNFDLSKYEFYFSSGNYYVRLKGLDSEAYDFTYDHFVNYKLGPFGFPNYFSRTNVLKFSENEPKNIAYLCPSINTKINNPSIVMSIMPENQAHYQNLYNFYTYINDRFEGTTYFKQLSSKEDLFLFDANLSIIMSNKDEMIYDVVIYYTPNLENAKFSCILYNLIHSNIENIEIVLAPNNNLKSDIEFVLNLDTSDLVQKEDLMLKSSLNFALGEFFNEI